MKQPDPQAAFAKIGEMKDPGEVFKLSDYQL
jgi:hypothetical protein